MKTDTIISVLQIVSEKIRSYNLLATGVITGRKIERSEFYTLPKGYLDINFVFEGLNINCPVYDGIITIFIDSFGCKIPGNTLALSCVMNSLKSGKKINIPVVEIDSIVNTEKETKCKEIATLNKETVKIISRAAKFTDHNAYRAQMDYVFIDSINVVASDSHILFFEKHNLNLKRNIFVSQACVKFLNKCKTPVSVFESKKEFIFKCGDQKHIVFKFEETYPDYLSLLTQFQTDKRETTIIDRQKLLTGIRQAAVYANQASNLLRFNLNGACEVSAADIDFSLDSKIVVPVVKNTFNGEIGLKSNYIDLCLNTNKSENVLLKIKDNSGAVLIDDNLLLIPMMINC
jgi:DNA polymerase III sliding clamp (beta) subunit (PCNA family)